MDYKETNSSKKTCFDFYVEDTRTEEAILALPNELKGLLGLDINKKHHLEVIKTNNNAVRQGREITIKITENFLLEDEKEIELLKDWEDKSYIIFDKDGLLVSKNLASNYDFTPFMKDNRRDYLVFNEVRINDLDGLYGNIFCMDFDNDDEEFCMAMIEDMDLKEIKKVARRFKEIFDLNHW